MTQIMESIDLARHDSLTTLARSSAIANSHVNHNAVYFSSSCNHLSAKFIWNINGPNLEILSYNNKCANRLLGLFEFGQIFDDESIAISCVTRLTDRFEVSAKYRHPYKLIVILSLANNKSYICIVDVRLNSVLNTIDFPFNATYAEVILSGTPNEAEKWPLARELLCMNGILAVGCDGGLVFFIDLILDSYSPVPLIPKQISYVTCNSAQIDLVNKRRTAIFHNQVICIPLNTDAKSKGKFHYRATDGNVLAAYPSNQIYVSALHFVPQLALISVGYNFGGFHLYNLNLFKPDFSFAIDTNLLPVVSFAFQVPENDPKNFSYLWVVRGICSKTPNLEETWHKSCCTANLYLLCYENKEYFADYGILYNTFKTCVDKFDISLPYNPYDQNSHHHSSSKLLDMFTLHQVSSLGLIDEEASQMEVNPIDYNLIFIAWQARSSNDKFNSFFLLFDLNQWYKTQMPRQFCVDDGGQCPFMAIYSLNSLAKVVAPDSIQAIYLHNNSISKYTSNLFYHDIHSYPASLSFNLTIASQTKICNSSYLGLQKQILNQFVRTGPRLLVDPEDVVTKCLQNGLISPEYFSMMNDSTNEILTKRELLMSIALENSLTAFLITTIKEWASDMMTDLGCDLKHILDWLWKKVSNIKECIDVLTTPLFDFSGYDMMPHDMAKLFSHEANLSALSVLLKQLRVHATILTQQSADQLASRSEIVDLIRSYLKIILLFKEFNLLPEQEPPNSISDSVPFYSYDRLVEFYSKRRQQVSSINPSALKKDDVLLIDTMVRHLEPQMGDLWRNGSSRSNQCLYPPPNLHSLIRIFLVDSMPLVYKESILLYFLLDFCDHLEEQHVFMAQRIMLFMSSLHLSQGMCSFIRGIWFLDHQRYPSALQFLTHPIVTSALTEFKIDVPMFNALVQRAVQLFLFANEYKSALIFSQCCGYLLVDTEKNENLYIQMLLLNDNLMGAIDFQRQRRGNPNSLHMVRNLFFVCEKTNNLVKLCRIPLDEFEEQAFVHYLLSSGEQNAKRILILYFILNNKLLEAIDMVKELGPELDMAQEENRRILELTEAYCSRIPHSLSNLAEEMASILSKSVEWDDRSIKNIDDATTIKINAAKQRNIKKISLSLSIEKVLEMKESLPRRLAHGHSSPSRNDRQRPMYLSPNVSRMQSKVTKAKYQSGARDLFSVLKTPEVVRKMDVSSQFSSFTDSPRKPSILKHAEESESDRMSECHNKLKVSFATASGEPKTPTRRPHKAVAIASENQVQFDDDSSSSMADQSEFDEPQTLNPLDPSNNNQDTDSDSSSLQRSRVGKKSVDTPTHRMKLRSKKPSH